MFKALFFLLLLTLSSHALDLNFKNFSANFTQVVIDENKKELRYEGKVYAKYPNASFWSYIKPVQKEIFINKKLVTIVESDLEQVIIQNIENEIDILKLLQEAQKVSEGVYETDYMGVNYRVYIEKKLPVQIEYKDKFENKVSISFQKVDITTQRSEEEFIAKYPEDFDVIKQ